MSPHASGRVGLQPAQLHCTRRAAGVRVDCAANPEFWLEYDAAAGTATGRIPTDLYMLSSREAFYAGGCRAPFAVAHRGSVVRINHPACPEFWLDITLSDA